MKQTDPASVDAPREFRAHEMFFSTTDRKGTIRSGNEVFQRISGYPAPDLIGRPHNIIRHPDMPRAVFRLVWHYLKRGKPVAGYVKNRAADGRHYWVVTMIAPLREGYLSIRFKPTSALHGVIESLYREMRAIERDAAGRGAAGRDMDLAAEKLLGALGGLGFSDYDAFMVEMLHSELKSRDAAIARSGCRLLPDGLPASSAIGACRLQAIYQRGQETYSLINRLYGELDEYVRLHRELHSRFANVVKLVREFQLVALNAVIKCAQLGETGRCTGVIASYLGELSSQVSDVSRTLAERMQPVAVGLQSVIFNLAAARLQLEMIMVFCHELATAGAGPGVDGRDVDELQAAFDGTIGPAVEALHATETALSGFGSHAEDFRKLTLAMQVAQITGLVEASRLRDDGSLSETFASVRDQTATCKRQLDELVEMIARFRRLASAAPAIIQQITAATEHTRQDVREFLALLAVNGAGANRPSAPADPEQSPPAPPARAATDAHPRARHPSLAAYPVAGLV